MWIGAAVPAPTLPAGREDSGRSGARLLRCGQLHAGKAEAEAGIKADLWSSEAVEREERGDVGEMNANPRASWWAPRQLATGVKCRAEATVGGGGEA